MKLSCMTICKLLSIPAPRKLIIEMYYYYFGIFHFCKVPLFERQILPGEVPSSTKTKILTSSVQNNQVARLRDFPGWAVRDSEPSTSSTFVGLYVPVVMWIHCRECTWHVNQPGENILVMWILCGECTWHVNQPGENILVMWVHCGECTWHVNQPGENILVMWILCAECTWHVNQPGEKQVTLLNGPW